MCKFCFKNHANSNQLLMEKEVEEQWMRRNIPPKKRIRCSYLEPDDETLLIDYTKTHRAVAIGLLRNGNIVHKKPLKINNKLVLLQNTCSFDTISQLFCVAYCDSAAFQNVFSQNPNNFFANLLQKILKSGITAAYTIRGQILLNSFPHDVLPGNILCVQGESTLFNTVSKVLNNFYMGTETRQCMSCKNEISKQVYFLSVEISCILELNKNVADFLSKPNERKTCLKCNNNVVNRKIELFNNYVLIEPINIHELSLDLKLSLDSVPKSLKCGQTTFILRGLVGYQGDFDPNHLGHFVAYGYRHNDKWLMYNDMLTKVQTISPTTVINAVLFFYSI